MSLTDDDKRWISELLTEHLVPFEQRLNQQAVGLVRLEERLNQQAVALVELEERLNQRIERVETSLLTEFHKWASPAEARHRTISAALRAIDLEMEQL